MSGLEFGLAIVGVAGTVDVCIKWGKALVQAYKNFQGTEGTIDEMVLRVEVCWMRVSTQLEVARTLEGSMNDEQKDIQQRTLNILKGKLDTATQRVAKLLEHRVASKIFKLKFVVLKDTLEEAIMELESWQKLYEPSWFHLIKLGPPAVDEMLNKAIITGPKGAQEPSLVARHFRRAFKDASGESQSVFIREEDLKPYSTEAIPFCAAMMASRPGDCNALLIDTVIDGAVQARDARDFARRLRRSDPFTFGLFSCKGVVRHSKTSGMAFIFRVPEGYPTVRSVRQLLLSNRAHDSLSDRLEMARQLVNAVYYVHIYGFVHKNIRPETVLSLSKAKEGSLPRTAFLIGFQVIRNADGRTYPVTDGKWEANLYRHPLRQGSNVEYYVMQHDVYSLGVCLLEIGLWESLIAYDADGVAQPSAVLGLSEDRAELRDPFVLKNHLVAISRSSALRAKMGTRYSRVVETCLTCLDEDNLDFGDEEEFKDEDGVTVGARYVEKVLEIINGILI